MKKHSLAATGLSLSSAQSISNQCNQRALDIDRILNSINVCKKIVKLSNGEEYPLQQANPVPGDIIRLLEEKGELFGCVAFLRENMDIKEQMLKTARNLRPNSSMVIMPVHPDYHGASLLPQVKEEWGWEQLSAMEMNEFYHVESQAAHIGKFIHKGSILEKLRVETSKLVGLEWMEVTVGTKSPVIVTPSNTAEELSNTYTELAGMHRKYEARTNYYKAKVQNLVTSENARIAKVNADENNRVNELNKVLETEYNTQIREYRKVCQEIAGKFEVERQQTIKEISSMRIQVPTIFQPIVDKYNVAE